MSLHAIPFEVKLNLTQTEKQGIANFLFFFGVYEIVLVPLKDSYQSYYYLTDGSNYFYPVDLLILTSYSSPQDYGTHEFREEDIWIFNELPSGLDLAIKRYTRHD